VKQEERFLRDLAKVRARIENGHLKSDVKIGEAIGRLKERLSSSRTLLLVDLEYDDAATGKRTERRET